MSTATALREVKPEPTVSATAAPKVYAAMVAVMEAIGKTGIAKSRNNQSQGYKFRGIDDVYNELNGLLSANQLLMLPSVVKDEQVERTTAKGSPIFYTRLTIDFKLVSAEDGSSDTIRTVGEAMDSADKSSNKAQSAAYKYAAMMVFCIPTEGDNDADATTHDVAPRQAPQQRQQPPASAKGMDISERVLRAIRALSEAPDITVLEQRFAAMSKLCAELSTSNPGLLTSVERARADRTQALEARDEPAQTPFDDEIPF